MQTDKNTVIGFVLLGILFVLYFWQVNKNNDAILKEQQRIKDSTLRANPIKSIDPKLAFIDSVKRDSILKVTQSGNFSTAAIGKESFTSLENDLIKVTFSNKGGSVKKVELKKYTSYDKQPVILGSNDKLGYTINTGNATVAPSSELYFNLSGVTKGANGDQTIEYKLNDATGRAITHQYTIKPNDYMLDWNLDITGANSLLTNGTLNLSWNLSPERHEGSSLYERQMTNICFSEDNSFDYISSKKEKKFEHPVQWVGIVQQFFNTTLVAKNNFNDGNIAWDRKTDSSNSLANIDAALQIKVSTNPSQTIPLQLYFGPNDLNILKKEAEGMDKMVNLGRDVYSFVRPINRYIIKPVFDFFASIVSNFGWVIMLLTIFIRLVTSPLTYTSYLSGAKMKVLRPDLDALKAKFGEDQQGFAMEQMKLFREAGVNPLGGCIPALLQIPIFFALYSFFNSNINLRGQSFLWSHDLSQYDSIFHLPFTIPMGYGDHVSLFTITAVATSFLISIYNMASTPTQDNPAMKYMPYIFPFFMLFFFNKLPSALTWYYTVSNSLTLLLQFVIQNYIIDHDKILAKMQEARKKPKAKSKWQERYAQVMDSQKKIQDLKNKTSK